MYGNAKGKSFPPGNISSCFPQGVVRDHQILNCVLPNSLSVYLHLFLQLAVSFLRYLFHYYRLDFKLIFINE